MNYNLIILYNTYTMNRIGFTKKKRRTHQMYIKSKRHSLISENNTENAKIFYVNGDIKTIDIPNRFRNNSVQYIKDNMNIKLIKTIKITVNNGTSQHTKIMSY